MKKLSTGFLLFSALTLVLPAFSKEASTVVSPVMPGASSGQMVPVNEQLVARENEDASNSNTGAVNLTLPEKAKGQAAQSATVKDVDRANDQFAVDVDTNAEQKLNATDDPTVQIIFDGNSSEQVKVREKKIALLLSTVLNLSNYVKLKDDELLKLEREHCSAGAALPAAENGSDSVASSALAGKSTDLGASSTQGGEPFFILRKFPRSAAYLKATDAKLRVEFAQEYEEWLWGQQWSAISKYLQDELPSSALAGRLSEGADLAAYGLALQLKSDFENGASLSVYKSFVGAPRRLAFASQFFREHYNNLKESQLKALAKSGSLGDVWLKQAVMDAAQLSYLARKAKLKAVVLSGAGQGNADSLSFENRQINFLLDHQLEQKIVFEELTAPLFPQVALEKH